MILASVGDLIATVEREQIQEFIDVGEYGLALETLAGAFEAGTSALPHSAFKVMDDLAQMMGMQSEVITDDLRRKVM